MPYAPLPVQVASGALTIELPRTVPAGHERSVDYISPSTTYVTLWIDSDTVGFRDACSPAAGQCTLNWTSANGSHTFYIETDDARSPNGPGNVLADNSQIEDLVAGKNTLAPIALNGVVATVAFISETGFAANSSTCVPYTTTNCRVVNYAYEDADDNAIQPPGLFDSNGLCVYPSNFSIAFNEICATAPSVGVPNDVVGCFSGEYGTFTMTARVTSTATPYGELKPAQLATYLLTYPSQTYAMPGWPTYTCTNGNVSG